MNLLVSVVIPVFNQFESLKVVLNGFEQQNVVKDAFELIIVDDGSTDGLDKELPITISHYFNGNVTLIHQKNKGRAAARNAGIKIAHSEVIIFCDGDRIPHADFIKEHIATQNMYSDDYVIVLGYQYDYFGNIDLFKNMIEHESEINKLSRVPNYFKRISSIYIDGKTRSDLAWLSFLVGNSSVSKKLLIDVGAFDEEFSEWGFEHFELGLRMQNSNAIFNYNANAINYHIPHARDNNFYIEKINISGETLIKKHPYVNIENVVKLLLNNINPKHIEQDVFIRR